MGGMRRHRIRWVLLALAGLALLAPVGAYVYYHARGEHWFRLRPTSYWRREVLLHSGTDWKSLSDRLAPAADRAGVSKHPRWRALMAREPDALPVLLDLLRDGDPLVRSQACLGLMDNPGPPAAQALARAVFDDDELVRHVARCGLRLMGSHQGPAVPALRRLVHDQDERVRAEALELLLRINPEAAVQAVLNPQEDP